MQKQHFFRPLLTKSNPIVFLLLALHLLTIETAFAQSAEKTRKIEPAPNAGTINAGTIDSSIKLGNYHAIIIGNRIHEHLSERSTSENDAIAMEGVLRDKYGFKTRLLLNANRTDILKTFNEYRKTLTEEENLLVFYSGHAALAFNKLFWLPVEAEIDNDTDWIPNQQITQYLETMKAKHIMVVADCLYNGSFNRTSAADKSNLKPRQPGKPTPGQARVWIEKITSSKVRTAIFSNSANDLRDQKNSRHSIFSAAIIEELQLNTEPVLFSYALFSRLQDRVTKEARRAGTEQSVLYSPLRVAGHETGEFLFVQKKYLNKN